MKGEPEFGFSASAADADEVAVGWREEARMKRCGRYGRTDVKKTRFEKPGQSELFIGSGVFFRSSVNYPTLLNQASE
jgi:hypothetical protein